ncbi:MAG: hypothetical protein ACMXX9_04220 [Candidatus Woesearchaeota archaeon]
MFFRKKKKKKKYLDNLNDKWSHLYIGPEFKNLIWEYRKTIESLEEIEEDNIISTLFYIDKLNKHSLNNIDLILKKTKNIKLSL